MKRKHQNTIWATHRDFTKLHQTVSADGEILRINLFPGNREGGIGFSLTRKDSRMLARRINQCLDATVKS